jgi:predicted  nucleic acid-binding Zn-ribbon protein
MAGERTFVVKILGNADGAITAFKNLAREGQESFEKVQSVGSKLGAAFDFVKKGAFIALGALTAVGGAAAAAVAAAAADEKSQKNLEAQLIRSAGATTAQVQATEAFIEKAMLATGIADDELRPAFGNLARATGDLEKSQRLFALALDISAATGRDLEAVTLGLGRAATGNIGALTRLGIPLDENTKKSKDFGAALVTLEQQFGGAAATAADTFAGRVKILRTSLGEVVEEIGYQLLPVAEKLVGFLQKNLLPALQGAVTGFKEQGLSGAVRYFGAAFGDITFAVLDNVERMILGFIELEKKFVNLVKPLAVLIDIMRALGSAITGGDGIITIEGMLEQRTESVAAKFDAWRNSIINTRAALNLSGNTLSTFIDQTDRIGSKVLKKAKESTDDWNGSLDDLKTKSGGASKTVETAAQKLDKYTSALKSSTTAQKSFTSAQKAAVQAQKGLDEANTDLATAQENFNRAIAGYGADSAEAKAAQRELSKSQRAVAQAGFRVEESIFAVSDAEKKLAELRADPTTSAQAIREAEISLAQAKLAVADASDAEFEATNGLEKAQLALNEAVSGAISGSATYNFFLGALNNAKERQQSASDALTSALDRETEAYENLAEAIKKVADAAATMPNRNLNIPTLPPVPTPMVAGGGGTAGGGAGTNINITTGIGTNGIEAGRQIVEVLQQYSRIGGNNFLEFAVA